MKRIILAAILAAPFALCATGANAQATRTWVSGVGDDVNPCSRTAPCKTFAGAISKTATAGEISVLDPGGFGAINITKSITIDGGGIVGSILALNVNGVIVNGAGAVVNLRNITINGGNGTTGNGVRIVNADTVNLDNVSIQNFNGTGTNGRGIVIDTAGTVRVNVNNTSIFDTNNHAIHSNPTGGTVNLSVNNSNLFRSVAGSGIQLRQLTTASIRNTLITGYTVGGGVTLELTSATAMISGSTLADNSHGIFAGFGGGTPIARLSGSTVTGNTVNGLFLNGGTVVSHGNNAIRGNAGNEAPSSNVGTQ